MDGIQIDSQPFFTNDSIPVRLYRGSVESTGQEVVVKSYDCYDSSAANQHLLEAFTQGKLDHPHICRLIRPTIDMKNGRFVVNLVMERLRVDLGTDIDSKMQPYTEAEVWTFLREIGGALEYIHSKAIAHRDIKPDNIFLSANGVYKLGDFGEFWERKTVTQTQSSAGSLLYMSPLVRRAFIGEVVSINPMKSDVYSLGVTLLTMCKRSLPMNLNAIEGLGERIEQEIRQVNYSDRLKDLLRDMLNVNETERISMKEVMSFINAPSDEAATIPSPSASCGLLSAPFHSIVCRDSPLNPDSVYVGQLQRRKPNGLGALFSSCGEPLLVGSFHDGFPCGQVLEKLDKHSYYLGEVSEDGKRHGSGIIIGENDCELFIGEFRCGVKHGRGKEAAADGSFYYGKWLNGVRHGKGFMKSADRGTIPCKYKRGVLLQSLVTAK